MTSENVELTAMRRQCDGIMCPHGSGFTTFQTLIKVLISKSNKPGHDLIQINKFWLVRSFVSKDYIKETEIADSILLSLLMTSNEMCNTGHAP